MEQVRLFNPMLLGLDEEGLEILIRANEFPLRGKRPDTGRIRYGRIDWQGRISIKEEFYPPRPNSNIGLFLGYEDPRGERKFLGMTAVFERRKIWRYKKFACFPAVLKNGRLFIVEKPGKNVLPLEDGSVLVRFEGKKEKHRLSVLPAELFCRPSDSLVKPKVCSTLTLPSSVSWMSYRGGVTFAGIPLDGLELWLLHGQKRSRKLLEYSLGFALVDRESGWIRVSPCPTITLDSLELLTGKSFVQPEADKIRLYCCSGQCLGDNLIILVSVGDSQTFVLETDWKEVISFWDLPQKINWRVWK